MYELILTLLHINTGSVETVTMFTNSMSSCTNLISELQNAYGAYQMVNSPTSVVGAFCIDPEYGTVQQLLSNAKGE